MKAKLKDSDSKNAEFILSKNLDCFSNNSNFKIDMIFLNQKWSIKKECSSEEISLRDLTPNFNNLLKEALKISRNLIVSLPIFINLNEIAQIIQEFTALHLMYSKIIQYIL